MELGDNWKEYIRKNQIKKGRSGTRKIFREIKGHSITLMIDQRVMKGLCKLFGRNCLTTTIPAQLVKKYNCDVVQFMLKEKQYIFWYVFLWTTKI